MLKAYSDINTDLRKKAKTDFEKHFLKLINKVVFGKTMGNVRKHRDFKLVTTERRRNNLESEPNYHTTKFFAQYLLATEMKKTKILMNKPVHLGRSILELSEKLTYKFWNDYVKRKYGEIGKLCYVDKDSFIIYIKNK